MFRKVNISLAMKYILLDRIQLRQVKLPRDVLAKFYQFLISGLGYVV